MPQAIQVELDDEQLQEIHDAVEHDERQLDEVINDLLDQYVLQQKSIQAYTGKPGSIDGGKSFGGVEQINELPPPMAVLLGFESVDVLPGRSVIEFEPSEKHANPLGTLHGGIMCDLGDAAMASAYASTLEPDEMFATIELDAKYLKPVWQEKLVAEATVIKQGRRTGLMECRVETDDGDLVAYLNSICMKI